MKSTRLKFGIAGIVCLGLAACGGRMHDPEAHTIAQKAKTTSDTFSIDETIRKARANEASLLEHELQTVAAFAQTGRDGAILRLLDDDGDGRGRPFSTRLASAISERLINIAGRSDRGTYAEIGNQITVLKTKEEQARSAESVFASLMGTPPPSCLAPGKLFDVNDELVEEYGKRLRKIYSDFDNDFAAQKAAKKRLEILHTKCVTYHKELDTIQGMLPDIVVKDGDRVLARVRPLLGVAITDRSKILAKAGRVKLHASTEAMRLQAALAKLKKEAADSPSKDGTAKLKETVKNLRSVLSSIGEAAGSSGALAEQIEKIDGVLAAVSKGETGGELDRSTEGWAVAALLAAKTPKLIEDIEAIDRIAKAPPVHSLAIEKARLRATKANAERTSAHADAMATLAGRRMQTLILEWKELSEAQQMLHRADPSGAVAVEHLLGRVSLDEHQRIQVIRAAAIYLSGWLDRRQDLHAITYQELATDHAAIVDRSETALRLWETAVKQPVAALAAYHAAGVKSEELIALLQTLGVLIIGAGVSS